MTRIRRYARAGLLLALAGGLTAGPAWAAPAVALGYAPRYAAGFRQFDYVNPEAPKGGELRLPALGGFDTLNPFTLKGDKEAGVTELLFDTLAEKSLDEPFSMYGLLADDIRLAPDGLSVTFHLNPKARFSNGDPVLARDVVSSFVTLTQDKAAHPRFRFYWDGIRQAVAVDERTVRFDFKEKNAELHMIIAELPVFSHKWLAGAALGSKVLEPPVGSGPYRLAGFDLGKQSQYQRRDDYWAKDLPVRRGQYNFDRIRFRYLRDDAVRLEAFKAGEFDVVAENVAKLWARGYKGEKFDSGRIVKAEFGHENPAGMQGFAMNLRRAPFQDRRVREAFVLAFDFPWANHKQFYDQYRRSRSYFSNSELAASGSPGADELALLAPWRRALPEAVFGPVVEPPANASADELRSNLKRAAALLDAAGYPMRGSVRVGPDGQPLSVEFLTYAKTYERIVAPYARNLARLGITLKTRTVDPAVYQQRMDGFDYDMTVAVYPMSLSPGNEMLEYFGSRAAGQSGSNNVVGLANPAVDALLPNFLKFQNREQLVTASRALDRILRAEYLLVPNWHLAMHRVAYWNRLGHPAHLPRYYQPQDWVIKTWWARPSKTG